MSSDMIIDHDSTPTGRRLRRNRVRTALWIAVVEVILVAFTSLTQFVVIALGVVTVAIYLFWGKNQRDTIRQILWIAAASQALAIVAVLLVHFISTFVLILAGIFAAVALFLIFADRR